MVECWCNLLAVQVIVLDEQMLSRISTAWITVRRYQSETPLHHRHRRSVNHHLPWEALHVKNGERYDGLGQSLLLACQTPKSQIENDSRTVRPPFDIDAN
uniref:Transposase n=1 Tax=Ascaris lumbricoides TaxID=6252 RepID=A0A0M3HH63_ASCLU